MASCMQVLYQYADEAVSDGPWTVNESGRFRSVSFPSPNQTLPNTWSPTDRSIGQKLKVSTLQSYNPTSYSINAYKFMANTAFNRSFLPPICVVIWIYFLYYSPWRVRIWRKKWLLWFPGIGGNTKYEIFIASGTNIKYMETTCNKDMENDKQN